jgi:alcohol dehydrogenase (cytochrome c)
MKPIKLFIFITCLIFSVAVSSFSNAQLSYERILNAQDEPQNWLTYNGGYMAQRHSLLDQINKNNVENLELKWVLQNQVFGAWQSNPIVVDGIMYVTERPNSVMAVDAVTGRVFGSIVIKMPITHWYAVVQIIAVLPY